VPAPRGQRSALKPGTVGFVLCLGAQPFVTPIDKRDAANAAKLRFGAAVGRRLLLSRSA
jgi:hypothetical protein